MMNLKSMNEKEFEEFLEEYMLDCSGTDIGLSCDFEIDGKTYPVDVILTNYMILQDWKGTESYKEAIEAYSMESMEEYEELVYDSHLNTIRDHFTSLNMGGDDNLEAINESLVDFYMKEEGEIDFNTLYEAREDIQDELEERIEEE